MISRWLRIVIITAALLLQDTSEYKADYTLGQCRANFGNEIPMLIDGVTKLNQLKYGDNIQVETVCNMVVIMSKDIRDLILCIQVLKAELEDLSFAVLNPKVYAKIKSLVRARSPQRDYFLQQVVNMLTNDMKKSKIKGRVTGRPKRYYSIYNKMQVRGRKFAEIYDLVGVRVIVHTVHECYAILGAIHAHWKPVPDRFKDYITTPKFNQYQSLHTTVIGPNGRHVEIQIRTEKMHHSAEYGFAAHWKYKHGGDLVASHDRLWSTLTKINVYVSDCLANRGVNDSARNGPPNVLSSPSRGAPCH